MIFLAAAAIACSLVRLAAPHVRNITAGRELAKPGMAYMPLGEKPALVAGVWSPDEFPAVLLAAQGTGDPKILAIGKERADALKRAGCSRCSTPECLLYPNPNHQPDRCDRCGHMVIKQEG